MSTRISNILFDIGVVLLHLRYEEAAARIIPMCSPEKRKRLDTFLNLIQRDPLVAEYERGRMSPEDFFRHFAERTGFQGSMDDFKEIWCSIFHENPPMIRFGRELARHYNVYFLTNAGCMHVPLIYDLFPSLRFFKDDAVSCYLGEVKPDRAFYEKALAKFGISASTCLFIDDRPENIEGAVRLGLRSILYTTPEETIRAIRKALQDL